MFCLLLSKYFNQLYSLFELQNEHFLRHPERNGVILRHPERNGVILCHPERNGVE